MKKITLLFITLLAMSGMAFGQKEPKLLWERELVGNVLEYYIQTGAVRTSLRVSPLGNTFALSSENWSIFDRDGNTLWKSSDFGIPSNFNLTDSLINWVGNNDSISFFNGEYQLIGKIVEKYNSNQYYSVKRVDDGIIITKNGVIIKYDFNIKEVWRYNLNSNPSQVFSQKSMYQFLISDKIYDYEYLVISKEGKKINQFKSSRRVEIFQTQNKDFWVYTYDDGPNNGGIINDINLLKYDYVGKQLISLTSKDVSSSTEIQFYTPLFFPDGSVIISYQEKKIGKLSFFKINKNGDTRVISKSIIQIEPSQGGTLNVKMINDNEFMFTIRSSTSSFTSFPLFGVVNFENNQIGWVKNVVNKSVDMVNEGFLVHYGRDSEFKFINLDGTDNWIYKFDSVTRNLSNGITFLSNDFILLTQYDKTKNSIGSDIPIYPLIKIRLSDGETMWRRPNVNKIFFDEQGNYYLSNQRYLLNQLSIVDFIPKSGKWTSKFYDYPEKSGGYYAGFNGFNIEFKKKKLTTITLESTGFPYYKSIVRKFSTENFYDSIPCPEKNIPKIEAAGNTEACPTEKVKLFTTKQDGLTYQWQKDGKDLPNVKEAVYDFGESGNYTLTVKDEVCQNSVVSNAIRVNIISVAIQTPKSSICEGEKTDLTATSNGSIFQWQKDEKDIQNATGSVFEVKNLGTYRVGVRDSKCPQIGYSNAVSINVKPLPEASISTDIKGVIYEPFTVKMSANSGSGLSYQWMKDDVAIPNETGSNFEAKKSGKYNLSVTKEGCVKISDALTISILIPLANSEEVGEEQVQIYPNPNKGEFKIILPKSLKSADIQLFDTFGRERSLIYVGEQAQAEGLMTGVYFLKVNKDGRGVVNKILVE